MPLLTRTILCISAEWIIGDQGIGQDVYPWISAIPELIQVGSEIIVKVSSRAGSCQVAEIGRIKFPFIGDFVAI